MIIDEFPFSGVITRSMMDEDSGDIVDTIIYEGCMDYSLSTAEKGEYAQTDSCIVSIPLIRELGGDFSKDYDKVYANYPRKYIMPKKNDTITISTFDDSFKLVVDNYVPSAIGGITIYCSRGSY